MPPCLYSRRQAPAGWRLQPPAPKTALHHRRRVEPPAQPETGQSTLNCVSFSHTMLHKASDCFTQRRSAIEIEVHHRMHQFSRHPRGHQNTSRTFIRLPRRISACHTSFGAGTIDSKQMSVILTLYPQKVGRNTLMHAPLSRMHHSHACTTLMHAPFSCMHHSHSCTTHACTTLTHAPLSHMHHFHARASLARTTLMRAPLLCEHHSHACTV
jgi:hypothetical protein